MQPTRHARPHARRWPFSRPPSSGWSSAHTRGPSVEPAERTVSSTLPSESSGSLGGGLGLGLGLGGGRSAHALLRSGGLASGGGRGGVPPRPPPRPPLRPSRHYPQGRLAHDVMPMVWTMRLMIMLPVNILPNRALRFRWVSLPSALSFATWLVLLVIAHLTVCYRLAPVSAEGRHYHVWDLVPKYASCFSLSYIVFLPFTSWAVTARTVELFEDWKRIEAMISALHGSMPLPPNLRARCWVVGIWCITFPVGIQAYAQYFLPDQALWMLPPLYHSACYLLLGTSFWNTACWILAFVARDQAVAMIADFERLGVTGLRRHRRIWLGLVRVMRGMSETWGPTQMVLLGIYFVCFVSISFLLVHLLVVNHINERFAWLLMAYILAMVGVITICASAHIMTEAIRTPAKMKLLQLSFLVKDDKATTEILQFLDEIDLECPRVTVCRLGVLDRSSILYLFGLANTYIVVLSQFSVSIETSTTANFTEALIPNDFSL